MSSQNKEIQDLEISSSEFTDKQRRSTIATDNNPEREIIQNGQKRTNAEQRKFIRETILHKLNTGLAEINQEIQQSIQLKGNETDDEIISLLKNEIETLEKEICRSREKSNEILKTYQMTREFIQMTMNQRIVMRKIAMNMNDIMIRKEGIRQDVDQSINLTKYFFVKTFDELAQEMETTKQFYHALRRYVSSSYNYTSKRSHFDKEYSNYYSLKSKLEKMKLKTTEPKKINEMEQKIKQSFSDLRIEGEHVIAIYNDIYNSFMNIMVRNTLEFTDLKTNDMKQNRIIFDENCERITKWRNIQFGKTIKMITTDCPSWIERSPMFKSIFDQEVDIIRHMEYCIDNHVKPLFSSTSIALSGITKEDINVMFSDIETIHRLHLSIFKQLLNSELETFIYCFYIRITEIYDVYKRRCNNFNDSVKIFFKCLNIPQFYELISEINKKNITQPKLQELLIYPFIHLKTLKPLFITLKENYFSFAEILTNIIMILTSLEALIDSTLKQYKVELELNKISNLCEIKKYSKRQFICSDKCVVNDKKCKLFLFNDMIIIASQQKYDFKLECMIEIDVNTTFEVVKDHFILFTLNDDSLSIPMLTQEYDQNENSKHILIDLKNNETTIHYAQKITKAKYDRNLAKIFDCEIKTVSIVRDETKYIIPFVLHQLFDQLEHVAIRTDGIFRESCDISQLQQVIDDVDNEIDVNFKEYNSHLLANLLKKYIKSMQNKLPIEFANIDCGNIQEIQQMLLSMKNESYLFFLERLFRLLHQISIRSDVNRMTSTNLAIVIVPNIFDVEISFGTDLTRMNDLVSSMIDNYEYIFDDIRKEFMEKINKDLEYLQQQKEIENELKHGNGMKEILISEVMSEEQNDDSMSLTLKSIIKQDKCEIHHGKKASIRWIFVKKNHLFIYKALGDNQAEMIYTLKDCVIFERMKNNKQCIVIENEKEHSNMIFENHDDWINVLKSLITFVIKDK